MFGNEFNWIGIEGKKLGKVIDNQKRNFHMTFIGNEINKDYGETFEFTIRVTKWSGGEFGSEITFGICSDRHKIGDHLGESKSGIGYYNWNSNDGIFKPAYFYQRGKSKKYGEAKRFGRNSTVTCVLNLKKSEISFKVNSVSLGVANFKNKLTKKNETLKIPLKERLYIGCSMWGNTEIRFEKCSKIFIDKFYELKTINVEDWNECQTTQWLKLIGFEKYQFRLSFLTGKVLKSYQNEKDLRSSLRGIKIVDKVLIRNMEISVNSLDFSKPLPPNFICVEKLSRLMGDIFKPKLITKKCVHEMIVIRSDDTYLSEIFFNKPKIELNIIECLKFECLRNLVFNRRLNSKKPMDDKNKFASCGEICCELENAGLKKYVSFFKKQRINGLMLKLLLNNQNLENLGMFLAMFKIKSKRVSHLKSLLSYLVNRDEEVSVKNVLEYYDTLQGLPAFGKKIIKKFHLHNGIFCFLESDVINDMFGKIPQAMRRKLVIGVEEYRNKFRGNLKDIRTLYCRLIEMEKSKPKVPDFNDIQAPEPDNIISGDPLTGNVPELPEVLCTICFDKPMTKKLGCNHFLCDICSEKVPFCPYCRKPITSITDINNHVTENLYPDEQFASS